MKQILFSILGYEFASWYVFFAIACIVSFVASIIIAKKLKYKKIEENIDLLFILTYFFSWIGARSFSLINDELYKISDIHFWLKIFSTGAMSFFGGFIGGTVTLLVLSFIKKISVFKLADVAVPALCLGLAIGRIGCFLNGCDFGKEVHNHQHPPFYAVKFPNLNDNIYRYPTQLEESLFAFLLFIFMMFYIKKVQMRVGFISSFSLFLLGLHRFLNEEFRGDERGMFLNTSLSLPQGISIFVMIFAICLFYLSIKKIIH